MTVINETKCIGCQICMPYCPVGAFKRVSRKLVAVDQDLCVECWVCWRKKVCPYDAIETVDQSGTLRELRHFLSDPVETHPATGVPGRGTEESKTNDVTGRTRSTEVGFCIDMGRPGVGVRLADVQKVGKALAKVGFRFEDLTPLAAVRTDNSSGEIQERYLNEHLLSIIIEGAVPRERFGDVIGALRAVESEVNTVFSVGVIARVDADGYHPFVDTLEALGLPKPMRGKVNVGLGRPLAED